LDEGTIDWFIKGQAVRKVIIDECHRNTTIGEGIMHGRNQGHSPKAIEERN
jgi:hypothetical protein